MRGNKSFVFILTCFCTLFLAAPQSYAYTITAEIEGIGGSISPVGKISVDAGNSQAFTIAPDTPVLQDVRVDGNSVGAVTSYTFQGVAADHTIVASFACPDAPVMLDADGLLYNTVMDAYQAASDDAALTGNHDYSIMLMSGTLPQEDINFNADISVMLSGGYDCYFQYNGMMTSIPGGTLTIAAGQAIPSGLTLNIDNFCQPGDPNNFLGNPEICDGADNNCNGLIDDGLGFDADGDGHYSTDSCSYTFTPNDDCNDNDASIYPGHPEICDNKDNNCDGQVDEGFIAVDHDGDGYAPTNACGQGLKGDCNDNDPNIYPGAQNIYGSGVDENCDGQRWDLIPEDECFSCHYTEINEINYVYHSRTPAPDASCAGCHALTVSNILWGHYGKTTIRDANGWPQGTTIGCITCHDNQGSWPPHVLTVWPKVVAAGGMGYETCDTCHEDRASIHATDYAHGNRIITPLCKDCHTSDTTTLGFPGTGTLETAADVDALHRSDCTLCHNYNGDGSVVDPATVKAVIEAGINGTQVDCYSCHGANWDAIHSNLSGHYDFINVGTTICGDCHQSAPPIVDNTDPKRHQDCTNCHNPDYTTKSLAATSNLHLGDQGDCTTCHGSDYFLSHNHHYTSNNQFTYDPTHGDTSQTWEIGCAVCHHDYDNVNNTNIGLSTFTAILYEHDLDGTKDGSSNSCYTCHQYDGSGSLDYQTVKDAITSGNPATCATCHTDKVPNVPHAPNGKHPFHLAINGVDCDTCHDVTDFPYFKNLDGTGGHTLAETDACFQCHRDRNGNPADPSFKSGWGVDGFVLACDSCHLTPPPIGAHLAHVDDSGLEMVYGDLRITKDFSGGQVSSTYKIGCGNCHPMNPAFHGNGIWGDVELANADAPADSLKARSPNASYDPSTETCSNVYCHSANSWATNGDIPLPWPEATGWNKDVDGLPAPLPDNIVTTRVYKQVNWNAGHTLGCTGCHQDPPESSYVDVIGGAGNSHYWVDSTGNENLHAWNMGYDPIGCRTCHYDTVQDASVTETDPNTLRVVYNDVALYDKSHHVNGTVDIAFDTVNNFVYDTSLGPLTANLSSASFDPATKTCSNVACHIQQTQVTWGLPYTGDNVECNRCHGNLRTP